MKKAIPVLIAIFLILIIGGVSFGKVYYDKYSYSKERADLNAYFGISDGEIAIILQDELIPEKAVLRDGRCYLDLDTVHSYLNEIFYADMGEQLLLYATPTDVVCAQFGGSSYVTAEGEQPLGYVIAYEENGTVFVAMDYVKLFTNYAYEVFDQHMQLTTQWEPQRVARVLKKTWVRERGGVKSAILRDVAEGETVEILEEMENWSKIKTSDSFVGYIENKRLSGQTQVEENPVTDYVEPEYTVQHLDGKVCLGFHSIGGQGGNDTLDSMIAGTKGMNVIAPTWFSLSDEEGNFRSFGSADYVNKAHNKGLQVWAVLDDFNYRLETGTSIDDLNILSSTTKRTHLINGVMEKAAALGVDGINLDFEKVSSEAGIHYVEFLRELSVACRNKGLVLSADNYVPFQFNNYYRLDVQGQVLDYCIIMGYDEHWHGSKDPGSVASIGYVSNGLERTLQNVPADKVVNALPFYTIIWKIVDADVSDEYLTMNNQASYMNSVNAEVKWDEETCQNYGEWTVGDTTYRIWLEDAESIAVKLNVMNTHNIGGAAVWRLGYGTPEVWNLLDTYVKTENVLLEETE